MHHSCRASQLLLAQLTTLCHETSTSEHKYTAVAEHALHHHFIRQSTLQACAAPHLFAPMLPSQARTRTPRPPASPASQTDHRASPAHPAGPHQVGSAGLHDQAQAKLQQQATWPHLPESLLHDHHTPAGHLYRATAGASHTTPVCVMRAACAAYLTR